MVEYKSEKALSPEYLAGDANDNKDILKRYEINCDMGEAFGPWRMGPDEDLMPLIDSANVACGGHAGDPGTMEKTVKLAKKYGVKVGAHPGLPDKLGFGRRIWLIAPEDIYTMVLYQVGALKAFLDAEGMELSYIKPHGELYFYIERDDEIKKAVMKAAKVFGVPLVAAKSAPYLEIIKSENQQLIQEIYPDLNYNPKGDLCRIKAGPKTVRTPEMIYDCIMKAGMADQLVDIEGNTLNINYNGSPITFCLHSDMPTALENAKLARKAVDNLNDHYGFTKK
ncbi:putative lactam utilization protein Lambp [[Candida] jaroonii]|uniref:Lactam utilization protein Lambp n=1 Tax=[Candida] jaroonii TaxID=467808 RepID=A0ACA9YA23_9ASCO|nr:putative lactam utilization protein Lambp [[Candida] jaroonii]